jgi:hypothetical protein
MGSRRTKRIFTDVDSRDLLKAIGECRAACIVASSKAPITGDVYQRCTGLIQAIDDVAEVLTGDRQHFWLRPHSAPPSG